MCIGKNGSDVLFVNGDYVFFGLSVRGMGEGAKYIQFCFGCGVDVVNMLLEGHAFVNCDTEDFESVTARNGGVVQRDLGLNVVFTMTRCDQCEGGFVCGHL